MITITVMFAGNNTENTFCVILHASPQQGCTKQAALESQEESCTYLAHHEQKSIVICIIHILLAHRTRVYAHLVGTWQKRLAGTPVNYYYYSHSEYNICEPDKQCKAGLTRSTEFLGGFTSEMDLYSLNLNERRSCLNSLAKLSPPCTRIHSFFG